jgi:hypothetical protein
MIVVVNSFSRRSSKVLERREVVAFPDSMTAHAILMVKRSTPSGSKSGFLTPQIPISLPHGYFLHILDADGSYSITMLPSYELSTRVCYRKLGRLKKAEKNRREASLFGCIVMSYLNGLVCTISIIYSLESYGHFFLVLDGGHIVVLRK